MTNDTNKGPTTLIDGMGNLQAITSALQAERHPGAFAAASSASAGVSEVADAGLGFFSSFTATPAPKKLTAADYLGYARRVLPYVKYLPVVIMIVRAVVQATEQDGVSGDEKRNVAVSAISIALAKVNIKVDRDIVGLLVDGVVFINNSIGTFKKN